MSGSMSAAARGNPWSSIWRRKPSSSAIRRTGTGRRTRIGRSIRERPGKPLRKRSESLYGIPQGEEDAGLTDQYDVLMAAMIRYWRRLFRNAELPFLFVQLPMWIDRGAEDTFTWPRTRLAQAAVRDSVRNTGMICLLDEGEYGNIHPVNKRPVGERLAELAGQMLYGEGEVSPRAVERWISGDTMTIRLSAPVRTTDGEAPRLLELAGEDGVFRPAKGRIADDLLTICAEGVAHPAAARYAWTDWTDQVNLFGENGLPLEPFRM